MSEFYNFIVPKISTPLTQGHIKAEELFEKIKSHDGSESYYGYFDMEKRPDYRGYQGKIRPALGFIVFDFDSLNLEEARTDALTLVKELALQQAWFFFSGSKGFHVYVDADFFNASSVQEYSNTLSSIKASLKLKTLDDGIIQANRKFRLPNSKHPKTGLYKVQIGFTEIQTLSIDDIKKLATLPRPVYMQLAHEDHNYGDINPKFAKKKVEETPSFFADLQRVNIHGEETGELPVFGHDNILEGDVNDGSLFKEYKEKVCVSRMWTAELVEGERHAVASILISDLHSTGALRHETLSRMETWAKQQGVGDRFHKDYVRMINEQYDGKSAYSYGCYHNIKKKFCSGTCGLYTQLKRDMRAEVTDLPKETVKKERSLEKKLAKREVVKQMGWVHAGDKGPKGTLANINVLLNKMGVEAQYDVIKKDLKLDIPNSKFLIDTAKNDKMNFIISYAIEMGLPHTKVPDFVATLAGQNPYNPVAEWVLSQPWDGISRLQSLFDTITAEGDHIPESKALKETLIRKWMISAIAGAFLPNGVSAGGALVFSGPQFIGKTNWFRNLVPKSLAVTKEGQLLDPKDKDSVHQSVSNWLVELGELDATFKKADIAQLKAFITKDQDTIRLPYHREPASFARRTVFFGSVNEHGYLNDPTGNRRFWTVDCIDINHTHGLPMQQVWAEVYELFKEDAPWQLTREEDDALKEHNEFHEASDPINESMHELFDWGATTNLRFMTCTDIAKGVLQITHPNKKDLMAIGASLRKRKFKVCKSHGRKGYWLCPLLDFELKKDVKF